MSAHREPILFDLFQKELSSQRKPRWVKMTAVRKKMYDQARVQMKAKLRRAHPFVLSDEAVRWALRLAHEATPERLNTYAELARLPHDYLWIEYSTQAYVKELNRLRGHGEIVSEDSFDLTGTFIHNLPSDLARIGNADEWAATSIYYAKDARARPPLTHREPKFFVLPYEYHLLTATAEDFDRLEQECLTLDGADRHLFRSWEDHWRVTSPNRGQDRELAEYAWQLRNFKQERRQLARLGARTNLGISNLGMYATLKATDEIRAHAVKTLKEFSGFMRFIVTALALINNVPKRVTQVPPLDSQPKIRLHTQVDYFTASHIELNLKKGITVRKLHSLIQREYNRRRAHQVRGHWRRYQDGRRIWIEPHQRGDASTTFLTAEPQPISVPLCVAVRLPAGEVRESAFTGHGAVLERAQVARGE